MPEKPVIIDNGPLVHLLILNHLPLLRALYTEVWMPQKVEDEFLATDRTVREDALKNAPWLRTFRRPVTVVPNPMPQGPLVRANFSGEDAVIALAQELNARLILIDDLKARRRAERIKLPFKGVPGVLLEAKHAGFIDLVEPRLRVLLANGAWLGPEVINKVLQEAGEA